MKKTLIFYLLTVFSAAGWHAFGQELEQIQCLSSNGKYGFKDKNTGETVISCSYDKVWNFSEEILGLAKVALNNASSGSVRAALKYGFIDKSGKEAVPLKYDDIYKFSEQIEGLALVRLGNSYGFIDKMGKEVISVKFANNVFKFSEGLAWVMMGKLYGFIDKTGKELISAQFSYAENFYGELAYVKTSEGKDGYIDVTGNFLGKNKERAYRRVSEGKATGEYNTIHSRIKQANEAENQRLAAYRVREKEANEAREKEAKENREKAEKMLTFSYFAKDYVEKKIEVWQQKEEFETTTDWHKRVTDSTREAKVKELSKDAEKEYIAERSKNFKIGNMTLGAYDADNQTYLIQNSIHGNWLVNVPKNEAPNFQKEWNNYTKTPQFAIINDKLAIAGMDFSITGGKIYKYSNQASLSYAISNIEYNFAPINYNFTGSNQGATQGRQDISTVSYSVGNLSDVAANIPVTGAKNDKAFAVIIANEKYRRESQVVFAKNDGEIFKKYCIQTLGLPDKNVHIVTDATLNDIRGEINWLSKVADAFEGDANIIFYYAGHGIPDESSRSAYLLPVDGYGSDVTTAYQLDDLYSKLGGLSAKSVIVFLDACFSGAQRSGEMLASARGVRIVSKSGTPTGNMVVLSAAQGDETAYPYLEKGHGMFTYFLLKKMQETKGDVTLGELSDYVTTNVRQQSIVVNQKSQTPTVTPSASLSDKWRGMKLR